MLLAFLPVGKLGITSLLRRSTAQQSGNADGTEEDDSTGVYHYGKGTVSLAQKDSYLQYDLTLEYFKAAMRRVQRGKADAASFFESRRSMINDAMIGEFSRFGVNDAKNIDELRSILIVSINESLHSKRDIISSVYFNSFLVIPPDSEE